jgi:hypothetical protein
MKARLTAVTDFLTKNITTDQPDRMYESLLPSFFCSFRTRARRESPAAGGLLCSRRLTTRVQSGSDPDEIEL